MNELTDLIPGRDGASIFLVGFMGAGKSEAGRALALLLGYSFLDLDEVIERRAGKSIREIFILSGEQEFRRLETEEIRRLSGLNRSVVALGGGAFQSEGNQTLLRASGRTVWLNCPFEVCFTRIKGDESRPLLGDEAATRLLFEQRRVAYAAADLVVETGNLAAEEIALLIAAKL
ncbi:MAG: shikimate kinase [Acidobacteriota bacterium]